MGEARSGESAALPYEEAVKRWAIARFTLDVQPEDIAAVDFDLWAGGGCPTCGPTIDTDLTVTFVDGRRPFVDQWDRHDLGGLIREVMAHAFDPPRSGRNVDSDRRDPIPS
jgi:hypothetical protein